MYTIIGNQLKRPRGFLGRIISSGMKKRNKLAYDSIIPELEIKPGDKILEIGYGHGLGIEMIMKSYDCNITGIDFSELMFKEATGRNQKYIEENKVSLHYGNYLDFKTELSSFDLIFFVNVIYFWDELEKPFQKLFSELKQGGMLCLFMAPVDYLNKLKFTKDGIFNKYTIETVVEVMNKAGFKNIEYKLTNGYYIKGKK